MAACSVISPPGGINPSPRRRSYSGSRQIRFTPSGRIAAVIERSLAAAEQRERESQLSSLFFANLVKDREDLVLISSLPDLAKELGYGAAPVGKVLLDAKILLARLRSESLRPSRVVPSADGGMAFVFRAGQRRRAYIEILNDGEIYAVTYSAGGDHVRTHPINSAADDDSVSDAIHAIRSYLEVGPLATGTL